MRRKPLLLFDMDGTLITITDPASHSRHVWHDASYGSVKHRMKETAAAHGVPHEVVAGLERMAYIWNAARAYADHNGFPEEDTRALMTALNVPFMEGERADQELSVIVPGTVEALTTLRDLGYEMALVTSSSRQSTERILGSPEYGRLGRFFTHTVTRDDCLYVKPDPEVIMKALRLHGKEDFVLIGDSDHDAEAAKAAGGGFILINTRGYDQKHLKRLDPDAVITCHGELPGILQNLGYA